MNSRRIRAEFDRHHVTGGRRQADLVYLNLSQAFKDTRYLAPFAVAHNGTVWLSTLDFAPTGTLDAPGA